MSKSLRTWLALAFLIFYAVLFAWENFSLAIDYPAIELIVCSVGLSISISCLIVIVLYRFIIINPYNSKRSNNERYNYKDNSTRPIYVRIWDRSRRGFSKVVRSVVSSAECEKGTDRQNYDGDDKKNDAFGHNPPTPPKGEK